LAGLDYFPHHRLPLSPKIISSAQGFEKKGKWIINNCMPDSRFENVKIFDF